MGNYVGGRVPDEKWDAYFAALERNLTRYAAAEEAGITRATADRVHKNPRASSGYAHYRNYLANNVRAAKQSKELGTLARRALKDFGLFRRRYFGHASTPWQVDAGHKMIELLESPRKEFVVVNCPPGSGKSTLFTHDFICWAIARNRALRVLIGTGAESTGSDYVQRIKTSMERTMPLDADEIELAQGLAFDAVATLVADFGAFKPEGTGYWRADKLVVARPGGAPAHQKEASVVSFGQRSGFLGGRYNLCVWDDVVNDNNSRSPDKLEELARWWKNTAETRLEPGGLLILQGQRLSGNDLYRYALDIRDIAAGLDDIEDGDAIDEESLPRKYHHIIYKAHDETKCKGGGVNAPEHHPSTAKPWPRGCLLDPLRLTYRDLRMTEYNDPKLYATVYQQEDSDAGSVLVSPLWINGGQDPVTDVIHPGCLDKDRALGEWPKNLAGDTISVVSADPSPTKYWAVGWWGFHLETRFQHLIDLERRRMDAPELLDWNHAEGHFTGLLELWWQRSAEIGRPITALVMEINAAQRFLLQYDHFKRWAAIRGVDLMPHTTGANKADPDYGVPALAPHYRHGRVRIPGHPLTRPQILPLTREVTRYPDSTTTDCVMMHWFLLLASDKFVPAQTTAPTFTRPTWMNSRRRGLAS